MRKTYFKKSLSVIMAVLMVMSCWVFVPGEHNHASAINYADVADDNVSQVTGYVTVDPVIYTHGTYTGSSYNGEDVHSYDYMMNGSIVADGSYSGEFHTNVSVNGKTLSSITCVDTGATLSVQSLSVWNATTNSFANETVLSGDLGGGYGYNTMDTKDSTATLKFTFDDGTYELRTLYVKTNPVAQHAITYAEVWKVVAFSGTHVRVVNFEVLALGSYGQKATADTYTGKGKISQVANGAATASTFSATRDADNNHGIYNFPKMYAPCDSVRDCYDNAKIDGLTENQINVDKVAGCFNAANPSGGQNDQETAIKSPVANYYLDLSSSVNSGITHTAGTNNWSINMFVGNMYNSKVKDAATVSVHEQPSTTAGIISANTGKILDTGAFNANAATTGYSTISGTATAGSNVNGTYMISYKQTASNNPTSDIGRIYMPFQITVVDKSALRNVFNDYVGQKLEAKHYTKASWTAYSHALSEADYYLNNYEVSTENEATLKANLETAYNNLVPRTYDLSYESLFSFSEWAKTDCRKGNNNGTVTVDEQAGTITLDGSGDFYTLYGGSSSYYQVPVTAGTEYTLSYDVTSTGGQQAYVFFYDDNGADVTGAISNGTAVTNPFIGDYNGNNITFTVPNGCTKIGVRFGINGTGKATFSNIALYSTARAKEIGLEKWTNRQYRKVFKYGDALTSTTVDYVPTREGYTFQKWYLDLDGVNYDLSEFYDTYTFNASWTLYSEWTINQYTVKFVDKDGKTVSETKYDYGTKASAIVVPATNSAMTKDATNHYTYSWPAASDLGASDVTYNEVTTATAHSWNDGVVDPDSTCTTTGTKTYTCTVCGQTKTETVDKKAHTLSKTEAKEATCETAGNNEYYTCSRCNKVFKDADGNNATTVEAEKISALGHKMTKTEAKEATCEATGNIAYWTCSVCGKHFSDANGTTEIQLADTVIAAKKHDFRGTIKNDGNTKNGTHSYLCKNGCGTYGNATAHSWNEGVVNPDPTCTKEGTKTYTCTADGCGATYTEVVSVKGHTEGDAKVENEVKATCENGGSYDLVVRCKVCNAEISTEHKTTEKLNHNYTSSVTKEPTCTEKGIKTFVCQNDKTHTYTEDINAKGHAFGETIKKVDATCTEVGHEAYKQCETCKLYFAEAEKTDSTNGKADTSSFVINALGHDTSKVDAKEATCTADGNKEYYTCSRCDKLFEDKDAKTETTLEKVTIKAAHSWNADFTIDKAATCEEAGSKSIHCSKCDAKKDVTTINALGHDTSKVDAKEATCTADGNKEYYTCSRCDKLFEDKDAKTETTLEKVTIKAAHSWNADFTIDKAATCEEAGSKSIHCSKCDATKETQEIPALKHNYDYDNGVLTRPTQKDGTWVDGYYTYTCKNDTSHTKTETAKRADYSKYDESLEKLKSLLDADITEEAKDAINELIDNTIAQDLIESEQDTVNNETEKLNKAFEDYSKSLNSYTVTFVVNGEVVSTQTIVSGLSATDPEAKNYYDATNHYTFSKWDKDFSKVTADLTVTAVFTSEKHSFTYADKTDDVHTASCACGYSVEAAHSYNDGEVTTEAKCETVGEKTYTCSLCDGTKTEEIKALGHNMTKTEAKEATCTEDGNKEYYTCSRCDKLFEDEDAKTETTLEKVTIKAAHSWNADFTIDKAATCEEAGSKSIHCSKCDAKKDVTTIDALGHEFTNETVDEKYLASSATCTEKAKYYKSCSVCDASSKGTDDERTFQTGDVLGHDYSVEVEGTKTAATCKVEGSVTMKCSRCNATTDKTLAIDPNNHQGGTELRDQKTANCHEKGYTGDKYCLDCQAKIEIGTETEIDKNNHVGETQVRDTVTATCSKAGYTGDTYCLGCNDKIETGHATEIDPNNHVAKEEKAKQEPTCTEVGYTAGVYCGDCKTWLSGHEEIPALGHDYKYTVNEPTCTVDGVSITTCKRENCDYYKSTTLTAPGHDEVKTSVAATCQEYAHTLVTCNNCDYSRKDYTGTTFAPHKWVTINEAVEATCTNEGRTAYEKCAVCKAEIVSVTIPKLPHVDEDKDGVCDNCDGKFFNSNDACGCICHKDSFIMRIIYAIARFFWKLFKIDKSCACGAVHY